MNPRQLEACLAHLEAAETLMVEAEDLAGLTRLSLVIEMLRRVIRTGQDQPQAVPEEPGPRLILP